MLFMVAGKWGASGMAGMRTNNTFTDFIACEHLVTQKWTSSDSGDFWFGTAGGLLMNGDQCASLIICSK